MRRFALIALAILGLGLLHPDEWESERTPVPDFEVKDLAGRPLRSADLKGKVAIVDFWATWCTPCVKELPDLQRYHDSLKGRADLVFLSFNTDDDAELVKQFAVKNGVRFPVYLAESLADPNGVLGYPTKLIVDARGATPLVRFRCVGATTVAEIERRVKEVLAGDR